MKRIILWLIVLGSAPMFGQELLQNINLFNQKQDKIDFNQISETWLKSFDINDDDIEGLLKRAQEKIGYGYFTEALTDIEKAISIDSSIAFLYDIRAICMLNSNRAKEAERDFNTAFNLDSSDVTATYYVAIFYLERQSVDSAETVLTTFNKRFPDNYLINYGLANLYLSKRNANKAIKYFKRSAELNPEFPEAWYSIGLIYILLNDSFNASRFFEKTLKYNPNFAPAYFMKGFLLLFNGKMDKTLEYWNKAIEFDSINENYKIMRGILKFYLEDFRGGFSEVNKAFSDTSMKVNFNDFYNSSHLNSKMNLFKEQIYYYNLYKNENVPDLNFALQEYLGRFLIEDYKNANKILETNSNIYADNAIIYYYWGINSESMHKIDDAEKYFRISLSKKPTVNAANLHLALLLQSKNNYIESIEYLNEFYKYDTTTAIVHRYRGIAYMQAGMYEDALNDFNRYFSIDSFDLDLTFNKGMCYKVLGLYKEAIVQFDTILAYRDFDNEVRINKAECQLYTKDIDSCLKTLSDISSDYYSFLPNIYLIRGRANLIKKNYDQALYDLTTYLNLDPDNIDCLYNLIVIYRIKKDYKNQVTICSKMLKINPDLPEIYYIRALAHYSLNNIDGCCKDLEKANELGYEQARIAIQTYCIKKED